MQNRARVIETLFRTGKGGREPLAPPGEGGTHIHYQASRQTGIGTKTSRQPGAATDVEYLAWKHGVTVSEVRRILKEAE